VTIETSPSLSAARKQARPVPAKQSVSTSLRLTRTPLTFRQQITASIRRRLADLQTYQLPRLRECKGPIDLQRELSAELCISPSTVSSPSLSAARKQARPVPAKQSVSTSLCKGPIDLQRELSAELKEDIRRIKRSLNVSGVRVSH
jgi:hypothetical protein